MENTIKTIKALQQAQEQEQKIQVFGTFYPVIITVNDEALDEIQRTSRNVYFMMESAGIDTSKVIWTH